MTHNDYVHYLLLLAGDGVIVDSRYEGGTTENAENYLQILLQGILTDADFVSLHDLAQRLIAKYKDGEYFLIAHGMLLALSYIRIQKTHPIHS